MGLFTRKIDPVELDRLLAENVSFSEAARRMGFSKQAVSQHMQQRKKLEGRIKNPPANNPQSEFEGAKILKKVISIVTKELSYLDNQLKEARETGETNKTDGQLQASLNFQRLKYLAEARKQIALVLEIDKERFSIEEVLKFQNFVLEKIGEIDEQTRDQIIEGLRRGKSLRRVLEQS